MDKKSGFKSSSIFSSWFRYGCTMGDLSRWTGRWICFTQKQDITNRGISYSLITSTVWIKFTTKMVPTTSIPNKLMTIFSYVSCIWKFKTRFWRTYTVEYQSKISILPQLVAFLNIIHWFLEIYPNLVLLSPDKYHRIQNCL